jgi:hypothetical protein
MIRFERGRTRKLASSTESRFRDLIEQNKTANNPTELLMLIIELIVLREEIVNTFKEAFKLSIAKTRSAKISLISRLVVIGTRALCATNDTGLRSSSNLVLSVLIHRHDLIHNPQQSESLIIWKLTLLELVVVTEAPGYATFVL